MHLGTKDSTQQLFSLFGAHRHLSESLSISRHLSASLGSFGILSEYIRNLQKATDHRQSPFSFTSVSFSSNPNSSYHLYIHFPTLVLFTSAYLLTVCLGTISGLLVTVKG